MYNVATCQSILEFNGDYRLSILLNRKRSQVLNATYLYAAIFIYLSYDVILRRNDRRRTSNDRYIGWLRLSRKKFKYKLEAVDYGAPLVPVQQIFLIWCPPDIIWWPPDSYMVDTR